MRRIPLICTCLLGGVLGLAAVGQDEAHPPSDEREPKAPAVDVGAILRKSDEFQRQCKKFKITSVPGEVRAIGEIAYRGGGPCEFLINVAPAKAHETVVLLDNGPPKSDDRRDRESLEGYADTLNNALMASGFKRGKPFSWNDETGEVYPPKGEVVHIYVEWKDPKTEKTLRARMSDWLWNFKTTHTMEASFVYTGSMLLEHDGQKYLGAELDGLVVAVLNTSTAIIDSTEDGSLDNGAYEAIPIRMPEIGTRVTVILSKKAMDGLEKYPPLKLPEELVKKRAEYLKAKAAGVDEAAAKEAQAKAAREKAEIERAVKEKEAKRNDGDKPEEPEKK